MFIYIAFGSAMVIQLLLCFCEVQILYYGWKEQENIKAGKNGDGSEKQQQQQQMPPQALGMPGQAGYYYQQQPGMMPVQGQPMQPGMQMQPGQTQGVQMAAIPAGKGADSAVHGQPVVDDAPAPANNME